MDQIWEILDDLLPEGVPFLTESWNNENTFDRYETLAKLFTTFEINYITEIESMTSLVNNTHPLISVCLILNLSLYPFLLGYKNFICF